MLYTLIVNMELNVENTANELVAALGEYGDFSTDMTATEFVGEVNTAFPDADVSVNDSATTLVARINNAEYAEPPEPFMFLHYSDSHGVYQSASKAAGMVGDPTREDYDADLAFAINTGDGTSNTQMTNANNGKHYVIFGNHDASDVYSKNYANMVAAIRNWLPNPSVDTDFHFGGENKAYWYKDFILSNGRKLRLFGTCEYEYFDGDGSYLYTSVVSQSQVDWLIAKLDELGEDDYFIVATHKPSVPSDSLGIKNRRNMNKFCSSNLWTWDTGGGAQVIFSKIVDAYKNKRKIENYTNTAYNSVVTINKDWTNASPATFLCFLCGHVHGDYHGSTPDLSNLLMFDIDTCRASAGADDESDIPTSVRTANGNILINKVTVDFEHKRIRVDRIGSQEVPARIVGENAAVYAHDAGDPNGNGYTYPAVTRDHITFDFDANVITE